MRTSTATAAWAAALAVMSMRGPFTTAEAAPARQVYAERPKPVYGKIRKRLGFNDSTETTTTSHHRVPEISLPSILGTTTSSELHAVRPSPSHHDVPLTTSTSEHVDPHRHSKGSAQPTGSKHDPLDPLLSSLLSLSSDSSSSLPPSRAHRIGSHETHRHTDDPNILSSLLSSSLLPGLLTGHHHHATQGTTSTTDAIIVGLTTILHSTATTSTAPGTGNRPQFHRLTQQLTKTSGILPTITGTGGIPAIISSVISNVSPVVTAGVTGPGTGLTRTEESTTTTATNDDPASNSTATPLPGGTANPHVRPANSVLTLTVDGTSVIVPVPTITGLTPGISPAVTTSAGTTTQPSPVVTSSNETETAARTRTEGTESSPSSLPAHPTHSKPTSITTNDTAAAPSTSAPATISSSTVKHATVHPQVSIVPTGTNTQTSLKLPSTWTFAPTGTEKASQSPNGISTAASSAPSSPTGLPNRMPSLVQPATGMPEPPANSTLIQVGFNFGLNYPFVVDKPVQAALIFHYLPQGIAYGLGISQDDVLMNALLPYDTTQSLGYVTTLAQTYIPSEHVSAMQLSLHAPASPIYLNPDAPVKALMDQINPTIPILPGASLNSNPASASSNPAATTAVVQGQGVPIGGDSGGSHKVNGTSVGIGAGAVAGAAVYAAAMIYVARRYRQKMKSHRRVSSVTGAGEMTQRSSGGMGSLFMSGANGRISPRGSPLTSAARGSRTSNGTSNGSSNGRSVREQGISAPLMSENSLGWN